MKNNCINCGEEIHPKRLEIFPGTNKCVNCSNTNKKAGVTITKGEGDHTYNDIVILEHDDFVKYKQTEDKIYKKTSFFDEPLPDNPKFK